MTPAEFFVRALVAGACIGVPSAIVGSYTYQGKTIGALLLWAIGAVAGAAAGLAVLVDFASNVTIMVLLCSALGAVCGVMVAAIPRWQSKVGPRRQGR